MASETEPELSSEYLADYITRARPLMAQLQVEGTYTALDAHEVIKETTQRYLGMLVTRGAEDLIPPPEQRPVGGRALFGQQAITIHRS